MDMKTPPTATPIGTSRADRAALPLSPHLQIWRFTPTMAASITQRATGVANVTGTLVLAAWAVSLAMGREAFALVGGFLASPIGQLIVFGYIWSISFHMLGGLRYLYTDTGRGPEPATARAVAGANFIGSFLLAAAIAAGAAAARS
ncbi:MAG: succinate dehydrogenase, cytochrome b556 subunit [Parvularculaceae bacterium]